MPEDLPDGGKKTDQQGTNDDGTINIPVGSVPTELLEAKHPNQKVLHTLKKGDEEVQVTTEELVRRAQKGWNADATTQQAAEMRKEAAGALALQEDLNAAKEGDIDAFRRIGVMLDLSADVVEAVAQKTFAEEEDEDVVDEYFKESTANANARQKDGPIDVSQLSPDVQRALFLVEKGRMDGIINSALDKDQEIAYNMKEQSPAGQTAIRKFVADKIQGRLDEFGGDFGDGTRILSEVLPEIKEHLKALGTPGQRTHTGLGSAPSASTGGVYPSKKPDHVPSTAGEDWTQHVLETLEYHKGQEEQ